MTVFENIDFALHLIRGEDGGTERVREILSEVGLGDKENVLPGRLSRLESMNLAIGKYLAIDPELLICDEPAVNLKSDDVDQVVELLRELNEKKGITIIVGTGSRAIAKRTKRMVKLIEGKTISFDDPDDD